MSQALTVTSEIGEMLITEARNQEKARFQAKVVRNVQDIMQAIRRAENQRDENQKYIDFANAQLAAVEAGEFTIAPEDSGYLITFKNDTLNDFSKFNNS